MGFGRVAIVSSSTIKVAMKNCSTRFDKNFEGMTVTLHSDYAVIICCVGLLAWEYLWIDSVIEKQLIVNASAIWLDCAIKQWLSLKKGFVMGTGRWISDLVTKLLLWRKREFRRINYYRACNENGGTLEDYLSNWTYHEPSWILLLD